MAEKNILAKFATFNSLFRFGCASPGELNSASYREPLTKVILSSGGRDKNSRVQTAYGAPEYSIDNIVINGVITPTMNAGNGPMLRIDFEVYEPYSMGLFLESMQAAALEKGYVSYLDNAAYVLQVEFVGQLDAGAGVAQEGPYSWCIRMKNITFTVDESGSRYKVESVPYNHVGFSQQINQTFTDVKLQGKTANEVLTDHPERSLKVFLNNREKQLVADQKKSLPDIYNIEFIGDNPFGRAPGNDLEFRPESQGGTEVVKSEKNSYDPSGKVIREKLSINPKEKTLLFSQETSVQNIINQILLQTKEARDSVTKPEKIDGLGRITFWKIDIDIKLLEFDPKIKDFQKQITFRINTYKIHHTAYLSPNAAAQGVGAIKGQVQRVYDYIYTGKNLDIVKFNIELKAFFFQAVEPSKAEDTGNVSNQGTSVSVATQPMGTRAPVGAAAPAIGGTSTRVAPSIQAGNVPFKGGAGNLSPEQKIANEFYMAYLNANGNMINLDLTILGDPYWLPELGYTNYRGSGDSPVGGNGTMNWEGSDIFTVINFRTPADPDAGGASNPGPGGYYFPYEGNHPFSGVYKVTKVESKWNGNLFTQTLGGFRLPAQEGGGSGDPFPTMLDKPKQDSGTHIDLPGSEGQ
jgi:hypothetical protein